MEEVVGSGLVLKLQVDAVARTQVHVEGAEAGPAGSCIGFHSELSSVRKFITNCLGPKGFAPEFPATSLNSELHDQNLEHVQTRPRPLRPLGVTTKYGILGQNWNSSHYRLTALRKCPILPWLWTAKHWQRDSTSVRRLFAPSADTCEREIFQHLSTAHPWQCPTGSGARDDTRTSIISLLGKCARPPVEAAHGT